KLILFDWPANVPTEVYFRKTVGSRAGEREVLDFAHQAFGRAVTKDVTVKLVGAALGDDVEDATGRLAIFRAVSTGLDFDFLHKFKRQIRTRSAKGRVTGVHAIEDVIVFWSRRPAD